MLEGGTVVAIGSGVMVGLGSGVVFVAGVLSGEALMNSFHFLVTSGKYVRKNNVIKTIKAHLITSIKNFPNSDFIASPTEVKIPGLNPVDLVIEY